MAYVSTRRSNFLGLGSAFNDIPGASPTSIPSVNDLQKQAAAVGDASKAQAIAYAQQQLTNFPSTATLMAEYNEYSGYLSAIPGFNPADLKDPTKCAALMKEALINYAKDNGFPTTTADAEKQLEEYAFQTAMSYAVGVKIPDNWPSNLRDLKSVAVDLACTAVVMETGIDPRMISVTAQALADGKLSPEDCKAIGTCAGAIAGATIAQSFGIPAPIGAFIGGAVGGMVGTTFSQIFSLGQSGAEEVQGRLDAMSKWESDVLSEAQAACLSMRSTYWQTFDNLVYATELQWELAEAQVGWKFELRWFGREAATPNMGQPFSHAWDPTKQTFTGAETSAWRAVRGAGYTSAVDYGYDDKGNSITHYSTYYDYKCPFDYGCPYPTVPGVNSPPGISRTVQAFLARGALWVPPASRNYKCSFQFPPVATNFGDMTDEWASSVRADLQAEQAAVSALQILSVTVIGDLIKTSAANSAERKMNDMLTASKDQLTGAFLARGVALSQAKRTGQNLSDFLNYGMLVLGAGLLGTLLWKKRKS